MKPQQPLFLPGLLLLLLLSSFSASAQSDAKMTDKLEKLYAGGKLKKCEKLAEKYRQKEPSSPVPVY